MKKNLLALSHDLRKLFTNSDLVLGDPVTNVVEGL